jgi:hypothetical protein
LTGTLFLTDDEILSLRLRGQRLSAPEGDAAEIVRAVCGVQAQDLRAAELSIRVRSGGLLAADVRRARLQDRTLVRTWAMRGTLHLLAASDLGWMVGLLGPGMIRAGRRRREQLGLDEETYARAIHALHDALADQGPLTRAQIVEYLAQAGIQLEGQARAHLIFRAALEGTICQGPAQSAEPVYVLVEDWIETGPALAREDALAELARRYLRAFGPATPLDFAAWSGLSAADARAAWRSLAAELFEIETDRGSIWLAGDQPALLDTRPHDPVVRLLPAYDTYLLGYRGRSLVVADDYAGRVNAGGGIIRPTLLVDGRVLGTWHAARRRNAIDVSLAPFAPLDPATVRGVETEVADIGRFLGLQAALTAETDTPDERAQP